MKKIIVFVVCLLCADNVIGCVATISYLPISPGKIDFTGNVIGCRPPATITYKWHFGDGDSSSLQNPSHIYAGPGPYTVTLNVTCTDYPGEIVENTKIIRSSITGKLNTDGHHSFAPKDSFIVSLIKYDSINNSSAQVISMIAGPSNSYSYHFDNVSPDDYLALVIPVNDAKVGEGWTCTYPEASIFWNSCNHINVNKVGILQQDISVQYSSAMTGTSTIRGNISYGPGVSGHVTGDAISGLQVYVLDALDQLITRTITASDGSYSFDHMGIGYFTIYPENVGYITDPWKGVNINNGGTNINHIDFLEKTNSITPKTTSIENVNKATMIIYPNPANDIIYIRCPIVNSTAEVSLLTITGQKVYEAVLPINSEGKTTMNLSTIPNGLYFIHLHAYNVNTTAKIVIQH